MRILVGVIIVLISRVEKESFSEVKYSYLVSCTCTCTKMYKSRSCTVSDFANRSDSRQNRRKSKVEKSKVEKTDALALSGHGVGNLA